MNSSCGQYLALYVPHISHDIQFNHSSLSLTSRNSSSSDVAQVDIASQCRKDLVLVPWDLQSLQSLWPYHTTPHHTPFPGFNILCHGQY